MTNRLKRRLADDDEAVANASDPDDGDWDASEARSHHRSKRPQKSRNGRSKKKRRSYSSDGIVDDDEDLAEDSFEAMTEESELEEPEEINPRTGRPSRSAAKRQIKYEESDDDIEDTVETPVDTEDSAPRTSRRGKPQHNQLQRSLIIKLPVKFMPDNVRTMRVRGKRQPTPVGPPTRRSSRLSREPENHEPFIELTHSGKHSQVAGATSHTPEADTQARRPSRGAKGTKRPPSTILEVSQEGSGTSNRAEEAVADDAEGANQPLLDPKTEVEASENDAGSVVEEIHDTQPEEGVIAESVHEEEDGEAEDSDEGPIAGRSARNLRSRAQRSASLKKSSQKRRRGVDESSDFEPAADKDDEESESDQERRKRRRVSTTSESAGGRRSKRLQQQSQRSRRNSDSDAHSDELDQDELAEEAEELAEDNSRRRRTTRQQQKVSGITYDQPAPRLRNRGSKPDYRVFRPELVEDLSRLDDEEVATPTRNRRGGGGGTYRHLFSLAGPFGGGGPPPLFGGPGAAMAAGGVDSDSSDDETTQRPPQPIGGALGMTPTSATMPSLFPQTHNTDNSGTGIGGGPIGLGKIKDRKALADADPLGVAQDISFDAVGGLDDHINKLKEMVMLPLLYPELFKQFNTTPPRGVLFHGPPGTGKTLLARALASSVSSTGQKVTFYMRKGADALSKWVGEAERQLRLLFEEARKNQPSIIFFDEIDGLAPVRSSKQEQIHASIVATLLALMDGMDGRGQVIVIGATNRPDSVDSALRRPGRFDREFYFPLPDVHGRRSIIDIHTKGWEPPLPSQFKDHLAEITNGYGGADLRALCAEAALNAIQGTYPQIYKSDKKLIVDPSSIKVLAKDFMISVNKMIPSSERAGHSRGVPLSKKIEPLLRHPLAEISKMIDEMLPKKRKLTALEEAEYDERDEDGGFEKEVMHQEFERSRVFRPRLLIRGLHGMGQGYLGDALLHKFEDLFVQSFDIATLLEDSSRSPEAAVIQLFREVRRHKPSVIFIPNVDVWYQTVPPQVIKTFTGLLKSLPTNEPILVLGLMESPTETAQPNRRMLRDLFGFSSKNIFLVRRPGDSERREYFEDVIKVIRMAPAEFPNPEARKKRKLADLPLAPEKKPEGPTKEQLREQKRLDRLTLNHLKVVIQPVMDQIKKGYRRFRTPIVDPNTIAYLFDEQDPSQLVSDLPPEQRPDVYRPYEMARDDKGEPGLREVATNKFYYNLDIAMIEKRLSNGYYKRPQDFLADIKKLAKDAKTSGDAERTLRANELLANVEVDMATIEKANPDLVRACEGVHAREKARERELLEKSKKKAESGGGAVPTSSNAAPQVSATTGTETTGPIQLGEPVPGNPTLPPSTPLRDPTNMSNGDTSHVNDDSHVLSNGSHTSPRPNAEAHADAHMADAPPPEGNADSSAGNTQTMPRSQRSAHTYLPPGSQPADYHNSASTTTSGQKTSDRSRSSGGFNTQSTNGGVSYHPDFSAMQPSGFGGSQGIPDTQTQRMLPRESNSLGSFSADTTQEDSSPSQRTASQASHPSSNPHGVMAPPSTRPHASNINAILNQEPVEPRTIVDEQELTNLLDELGNRSEGLSVEQLEQINATLMETVWRNRGEPDRNKVARAVADSFNEVISDIRSVEKYQVFSDEE